MTRPRRGDQAVAASRRPARLRRTPSRSPRRLPPRAPSRSPDRSAPCRARRLAGRAGSRHGHPLPEIQDNRRNKLLNPRHLPAARRQHDTKSERLPLSRRPHYAERGRLGRCRAPRHPDRCRSCPWEFARRPTPGSTGAHESVLRPAFAGVRRTRAAATPSAHQPKPQPGRGVNPGDDIRAPVLRRGPAATGPSGPG
jgi:hypothetical protein